MQKFQRLQGKTICPGLVLKSCMVCACHMCLLGGGGGGMHGAGTSTETGRFLSLFVLYALLLDPGCCLRAHNVLIRTVEPVEPEKEKEHLYAWGRKLRVTLFILRLLLMLSLIFEI